MSINKQDIAEQMFIDQGTYDDNEPETFGLSHKGGEYEAFNDLAEQVMSQWLLVCFSSVDFLFLSPVSHVDSCTQADCVESQSHHWSIQVNCLVPAYFDY